MFYIISTVFGILGVTVLYLLKVLTGQVSLFHEHQNTFNIVFLMLFVFLYNFCIYDYKPNSKIIYVFVNIIFIIVFVLVNKLFEKFLGV